MAYAFPKPSSSSQTLQKFEEIHDPREDVPSNSQWAQMIYRIFAFFYVVGVLLMAWKLRPGSDFWSLGQQTDRIPFSLSQAHEGVHE